MQSVQAVHSTACAWEGTNLSVSLTFLTRKQFEKRHQVCKIPVYAITIKYCILSAAVKLQRLLNTAAFFYAYQLIPAQQVMH